MNTEAKQSGEQDVTAWDTAVARFKRAWHEADEAGRKGERVEAGLEAALLPLLADKSKFAPEWLTVEDIRAVAEQAEWFAGGPVREGVLRVEYGGRPAAWMIKSPSNSPEVQVAFAPDPELSDLAALLFGDRLTSPTDEVRDV